jgi:hypothetical protein
MHSLLISRGKPVVKMVSGRRLYLLLKTQCRPLVDKIVRFYQLNQFVLRALFHARQRVFIPVGLVVLPIIPNTYNKRLLN